MCAKLFVEFFDFTVQQSRPIRREHSPSYQLEGETMSKYGHRNGNWFESIVNKLGGELGAEAFLRGDSEVVIKKEIAQIISSILTLSRSSIKFPGTRTPFKVSEKFTTENPEITWYSIWDNFQTWYWNKEEKPLTRSSLRAHTLTRNAKDSDIIRELGGEEKAETTLSELYFLLKKQARGQAGALLINGRANLFFIRDASGILRVVSVYWYDGGWYVYAYVLVDGTWIEGALVFSLVA